MLFFLTPSWQHLQLCDFKAWVSSCYSVDPLWFSINKPKSSCGRSLPPMSCRTRLSPQIIHHKLNNFLSKQNPGWEYVSKIREHSNVSSAAHQLHLYMVCSPSYIKHILIVHHLSANHPALLGYIHSEPKWEDKCKTFPLSCSETGAALMGMSCVSASYS